MKLLETVFYWVPRSGVFNVFKYRIDTIPHGGRTGGAVFSEWDTMTSDERIVSALANTLTVIIRDGVNPMSVGRALLAVDELRDQLPVDFPGMER